jgi:acetylornithine deacetylase/succinyl-diaminopimelate desuccinylase-like protein
MCAVKNVRTGRPAVRILTLAAILTAASTVVPAFADLPVDMPKAQDEALGILKEYLKIDTSNPPGNEAKGALFLGKILKDAGLDARIFETAPGRACVYARLKGSGKKKAVILYNHIDVVPACPADWQHPPFCGEEVGGEIWGRGTLDMKGIGVVQLESLLALKRSGKLLDRDVIFLATPDEEVGGKCGAAWFVKNHAELVKDAEYLFNEGSFIDAAADGRALYSGVDVAEKSVLWLSLTAKGEAGHASMPLPDAAINRLSRALARIVENPPEATVLPPVHEFFLRISSAVNEPLRGIYANIDESVKKPETYRELLKDKYKSSMLRNTISPTVLKAGYKTNVIPSEAYAELDCRLLPDVKKEDFIERIKKTINDSNVQVSMLASLHADASPYDTDCYRSIARVTERNLPGVPVVPMIIPWFTDSHWFRDLGICCYGYIPCRVDQTHLSTLHGENERLPVSSFREGLKIMYEVLEDLCAAR